MIASRRHPIPPRIGQKSWPVLLGLCLLLFGCIEVDETLTLAPDGSGTLEVVYGMPEQIVAQMEAVQAMSERTKRRDHGPQAEDKGQDTGENTGPNTGQNGGQGSAEPPTDPEIGLEFDPIELKRAFKRYEPQGVYLESADTETRDGWRFTCLKVHFKNLKGLLDTELFEGRRLSLVRQPNGHYRLSLSDGRGQEGRPPDGATAAAKSAEREPTTAAMLEGFHVATTVHIPGHILETNAHRRSAASAVWEYDIAKDPTALTRMGEERPYIVFEGEGLRLPEIRADESLSK
jgi:hypothetical protein